MIVDTILKIEVTSIMATSGRKLVAQRAKFSRIWLDKVGDIESTTPAYEWLIHRGMPAAHETPEITMHTYPHM